MLESYSEQPVDDRIPLHGGLPHPDAFPFSELTIKMKSGPTLTIDNQDLVTPPLLANRAHAHTHEQSLDHSLSCAADDRCTAVCNPSLGKVAWPVH